MNRYIVTACVAIFSVALCYIANFYLALGYGISSDTAAWAALGEYLGGVLTPALSFISIVLLIKSLALQNEANTSLRNDLKNSEKTEKIRSFEALFFNIIESQKELFRFLAIEDENGGIVRGVEAVLWIEEKVENMRNKQEPDLDSLSSSAVSGLIQNIDSKDHIFGITRTFYIAVKLITEKLGTAQHFNQEDRKSHFLTLINFTDYSQLRLILLCVQFMNFPSVEYLKSNEEFSQALTEVGLGYDLY